MSADEQVNKKARCCGSVNPLLMHKLSTLDVKWCVRDTTEEEHEQTRHFFALPDEHKDDFKLVIAVRRDRRRVCCIPKDLSRIADWPHDLVSQLISFADGKSICWTCLRQASGNILCPRCRNWKEHKLPE